MYLCDTLDSFKTMGLGSIFQLCRSAPQGGVGLSGHVSPAASNPASGASLGTRFQHLAQRITEATLATDSSHF